MPPPLLRERILKRHKIPVATAILKKPLTVVLTHPPTLPSPTGLTHPTHTPFPSVCLLCCVDLTVHPLQTTINMSVSDDRLSPGTFYINWPQVQLIRIPKLEPCSLGSVNVTAGESESFRGVSAAHLCNETPYLFLFFFIFYWKNGLEGFWGEQFLHILFF